MRGLLALMLIFAGPAAAQPPPQAVPRTEFVVKQVAAGVVYIDGGTAAGLSEGMRLEVRRLAPGAALLSAEPLGEITIVSLATSSALCEIKPGGKPIAAGDLARLSAEDAQLQVLLKMSGKKKRYAQVVSFGDKDPLEEELRDFVPRPPLPEVNRVRGRISFEHNTITDNSGSGLNSHQEGLVLRADMTRIGGTYWNFTGYWRGRINSRGRGSSQPTMIDLLNRTYHIGLFYNNPQSKNLAGVGRLLLPWAASLNTIDGGYYARRLNRSITAGLFGGSTPDPTAWNYNPDRMLAGSFISFEYGNFDSLRFTSTEGLAFTGVHWRPERRFLFAENGLFWKNSVSVYNNVEADELKQGRAGSTQSGPVLSRSFTTFRYQPARRVSFDLNHNYFRWVPTFDSSLIGTGLLDKLLFQGLSWGGRVELVYRTSVYTQLGRNKRETDTQPSWSQMYGVTFARIPWVDLRADVRYARLNSDFGSGTYESLSLIKQFKENFRLELQAGQQDFHSALTRQNRSRYAGAVVDWSLGKYFILGGGALFYRGNVQNYDQIYFSLGYRF